MTGSFIIRDNANQTLYSHNHEAQAMWRATQPEIDEYQAKAQQIFTNTRASLADEAGIAQWELIYDILPDLINDTLEDRRERVLERKRMSPPFTERWLNGIPELGIKGELFRRSGNDTIFAEIEGLALTITYQASEDASRAHRELVPWLRGIIPTNVMLFYRRTLPTAYIRPVVMRMNSAIADKMQTLRSNPIRLKHKLTINRPVVNIGSGTALLPSTPSLTPENGITPMLRNR